MLTLAFSLDTLLCQRAAPVSYWVRQVRTQKYTEEEEGQLVVGDPSKVLSQTLFNPHMVPAERSNGKRCEGWVESPKYNKFS